MAETFDASSFQMSYKVNFATDDAVEKFGELIEELNNMGFDAEKSQKVINQFLATFAGSAETTKKPLTDVLQLLEKIRDKAREAGKLTQGTQNVLNRAAQIHLLGNKDAASTDPLRSALFEEYKEGNQRFNPPGSGPGWLRGTQNIARMISYVDQLRRAMVRFVEENAKASRELYNMAQQAQVSVEEIAKLGGALEAFGGNKGKAASERTQFEVEMAKMRRGEGIGGKYMDVARLYGVRFHPNDFAAQQLEWARYLSDKSVSSTDKAGFISKMQFDAHETALYSRGPEFVKQEQALQAELHSNSKRASEATMEYTRSMQHMSAAWQDLKNGAIAPLMELLTPLIEGLSRLVNAMKKSAFGKLFRILVLIIGAAVAVAMPLAKVAALFRMAGFASKEASPAIDGLIKRIKKLGATASTSGGKTTTSIGGFAKGMAWIGLIMGLLGAASSYTKGDKAEGNKELGRGIGGFAGTLGGAKLGAIIGSFIAPGVGTAIGGLIGGIIGAFAGGALGGAGADAINRSMGVKDHDEASQTKNTQDINESVEEINRNAAMMVNSYAKNSGVTNNSNIEIAHLEVKVEGNGADPVEIAKAVPEAMKNEFRNTGVAMGPKGVA